MTTGDHVTPDDPVISKVDTPSESSNSRKRKHDVTEKGEPMKKNKKSQDIRNYKVITKLVATDLSIYSYIGFISIKALFFSTINQLYY